MRLSLEVIHKSTFATFLGLFPCTLMSLSLSCTITEVDLCCSGSNANSFCCFDGTSLLMLYPVYMPMAILCFRVLMPIPYATQFPEAASRPSIIVSNAGFVSPWLQRWLVNLIICWSLLHHLGPSIVSRPPGFVYMASLPPSEKGVVSCGWPHTKCDLCIDS
jgi:hypothetical protein